MGAGKRPKTNEPSGAGCHGQGNRQAARGLNILLCGLRYMVTTIAQVVIGTDGGVENADHREQDERAIFLRARGEGGGEDSSFPQNPASGGMPGKTQEADCNAPGPAAAG